MKILHVLDSLDDDTSVKQVQCLVSYLPRDRFDQRTCVLRHSQAAEGAFAAERLGGRAPFDPWAILRLRRLVRNLRPDCLHVWRMPALRAAVFAANRLPIIVSKVLPHRRAAWWKRWLLQRPRHILVASEGEADLARRLDLDANRIVICPPAVEIAEAEHVRAVGSDLDGCLVVAFGTERFASCGKVAVWAFDLVRHVEPMLRLALVGRCRERDRIAEFISQVTEASRVEFAESSEAHSKCLAQAKVAWVFAARNDGMDRLAEAWAAGLPVVTSDMPELAGRVRHEIDVLQVAANDPVALGRATRRLLDDPDLRHRLAEAGRERARRDFDPVRLAGCVARVYEIP